MGLSAYNDIIQLVLNAGPMVRLVLLLLLFFSITSWAIIFGKYKYIKRANKESSHFLDMFWNRRSLSEAYNASRQFAHSPLSRVFRVAYTELKKVKKPKKAGSGEVDQEPVAVEQDIAAVINIKRALRRAVNVELTELNKTVSFLATTGNTTPFIGLFGTVWGIMNSFRSIGVKGSATLAAVAPGISEALIATAAGLAAAIPAVVAYNFFASKIRVIESEMHNFSADFLNLVERETVILKGSTDRGDE
jgi:biopolymer transport protein TolQ